MNGCLVEAVKYERHVLQYAFEELKADKELVMAAVKTNGDALKYASDELKTDPEILALIDD